MQDQLNKLTHTTGGHQIRQLRLERHKNGMYFIHGDIFVTGDVGWSEDCVWAKDGTWLGISEGFNLQIN